MSDQKPVIVHVVSHETDARIVMGFLQAQGIEAVLSEDDAGDQLPSLEETGGVKIIVAAEDADRARQLLAERES